MGTIYFHYNKCSLFLSQLTSFVSFCIEKCFSYKGFNIDRCSIYVWLFIVSFDVSIFFRYYYGKNSLICNIFSVDLKRLIYVKFYEFMEKKIITSRQIINLYSNIYIYIYIYIWFHLFWFNLFVFSSVEIYSYIIPLINTLFI